MGQRFVYNTGSYEEGTKKKKVDLQFGVFFDGTANNLFNTEMRVKVQNAYKRKDNKGEEGFNEVLDKDENGNPITLDYDAYDRFKVIPEKQIRKTSEGIDYNFKSEEERNGYENRYFQEGGTSYANDYTNVARMYNSCDQEEYAIYIEGIGTSMYEEDIDPGLAFGAQESGVKQRAWDAINLLLERIKEKSSSGSKTEINQIDIDVFGFSRGAATARYFIALLSGKLLEEWDRMYKWIGVYRTANMARLAPSFGYDPMENSFQNPFDIDGNNRDLQALRRLISLLYDENKELKYKFRFRFLGIYDTVSSYTNGYDSLRLLNGTHFDNDAEQLYLHELNKVNKIIHFTAMDEHRENFSLTRIRGALNSSLHDKRIEKNFPGVHSDIGGSYMNETEVVYLSREKYKSDRISHPDLYLNLKKLRGELVFERWYKANQLFYDYGYQGINKYMKLTGARYLKKEYSYIPLHFMYQYFTDFIGDKALSILTTKTKEEFENKYSISNEPLLIKAKERLYPYVMNEGGEEWYFDKEYFRESDARLAKEICDFIFGKEVGCSVELNKERHEIVIKNSQRLVIKPIVDEKIFYKGEGLENLFIPINNSTYTFPIGYILEINFTYNIWKNTTKEEQRKVENMVKNHNSNIEKEAQLLAELRNKFFHWSANYNDSMLNAIIPMEPRANRERKEFV